MYTMKKVCEMTGLTYETLKFYCNKGLVPNVKRGENNYRVFDDRDVEWIKGLNCLKNCGMGINEMLAYTEMCLEGQSTILQRKKMLDEKKALLLRERRTIDECLFYIDEKQKFYDDVTAGKTPYVSNLLPRGVNK